MIVQEVGESSELRRGEQTSVSAISREQVGHLISRGKGEDVGVLGGWRGGGVVGRESLIGLVVALATVAEELEEVLGLLGLVRDLEAFGVSANVLEEGGGLVLGRDLLFSMKWSCWMRAEVRRRILSRCCWMTMETRSTGGTGGTGEHAGMVTGSCLGGVCAVVSPGGGSTR